MDKQVDDENAKLAPLHFLEGEWIGEGRGPHGTYRLKSRVERRGRWLLLTSAILDAKSNRVTYVSTQVYGYDDDGLKLKLFDTAGCFAFRGLRIGDELRFEFKDGENVKRSQYWPQADGRIRFRHESHSPRQGTELYEGYWVRSEIKRNGLPI